MDLPPEPASGAASPRLAQLVARDAFKLLRVLVLIVWLPSTVLALLGSALIVLDAAARGRFDVELVFAVAAAAGVTGLVGLMRGYVQSARTSTGGIELTQYLIVIGIVAAAALLAAAVTTGYLTLVVRVDRFDWDNVLVLAALLGLVVLGIDGLAQIQRGNRLLAARSCLDNTVPLSFLGVALAALAAAMLGLNV